MSQDKPKFRERFRYKFDNFMAGGAVSMFQLLFVVLLISFFAMYSITFVLSLLTQGFEPMEGIWTVFYQISDPGAMATGPKTPMLLRIMAILTGLLGIVIFSTLVAFITTQVEEKVQQLKKGRSKVLEEDHTLILGWNDGVLEIIREVILANENQKRGVVVVLSPLDKEVMEEAIHEGIHDFVTTQVICRSGDPIAFHDLDMVSVNTSKSVIVISEALDKNIDRTIQDSRVINSVLAICGRQERRQEPYHIVAELQSGLNQSVVESIGRDEVEVIVSSEFIPSVTIQASREIGLSVVLMELLSFDGNEIYFLDFPGVKGLTFGSLVFYMPEIVPVGYIREGEMRLNPPYSDVMEAHDRIIYVAEDDFDLEMKQPPQGVRDLGLIQPRIEGERPPEKHLILGWNPNLMGMIRELNDYVGEGSVAALVMPSALPTEHEDELAHLSSQLDNLDVVYEVENFRNPEILRKLEPFQYETITVLSHEEEGLSQEKVEANTIYTVLLLRGLREEIGQAVEHVKIISEILDPAHRKLIEIAQINDFIVSSHLISKVMAQISEQKELSELYEQLFTEAGPEFHVKPIRNYVTELPGSYSFYELALQCQKREEVLVGYKKKAFELVSDKNYGITVNPLDKTTMIEFSENDELVVLAEDEF